MTTATQPNKAAVKRIKTRTKAIVSESKAQRERDRADHERRMKNAVYRFYRAVLDSMSSQ